MATTVVLVDDHRLVRDGFRRIIESSQEYEVVGEAADGRDAVKVVGELRPDLVVMDIWLPLLSGVEATRQIKQEFPDCKVLMLTQHETANFVEVALRGGASGYVLKTASPAEFLDALHAARSGKSALSPEIAQHVVDAFARPSGEPALSYSRLTGREREVLQLIAEGHSNKEVAGQLGISTRTAEAHRANLMTKLSIHNTADLVRFAIREGLVAP